MSVTEDCGTLATAKVKFWTTLLSLSWPAESVGFFFRFDSVFYTKLSIVRDLLLPKVTERLRSKDLSLSHLILAG